MDFLNDKIMGFILMLTRVGSFFAVSPIFNLPALPVSIKVAMVFIIAVFLTGISGYALPAAVPTAFDVCLWIGTETVFGISLGLVTLALFSVVRTAAVICEQQMGLNMANIMDPLTEEQENVLSILIEMFFILLLFAVNGHHIFLKILYGSYGRHGPGTLPQLGQLVESVIVSGSALLMLSLQMSAPILAAFLVIVVVLAIMAKIAPEANILFLSFPIRIGIGLVVMGIFVSFINDYIRQFVIWLDKTLIL